MSALRNKKYYGGLVLFIIVNSSLVFLLFSPYLNNIFLQYSDDLFLAELDEKIQDVRTDTFTITFTKQDGTPLSNMEVGYNLIRHDFYFGCNFFQFESTGSSQGDKTYEDYFKNLFNLATLPFYWTQYESTQGNYPRDDILSDMIDWCDANGITKKGHPLAWRNPSGCPTWLPDDKDEVELLLKNRIQRILNLYKDRIDIWDVVNEPTHLPPIGAQTHQDYISECFSLVAGMDPDAKLTLNDYGILGHDFGYGPYYNLIQELLQLGVPIDYIGLQGREPRMDWIPAREIWQTLEAYSVFNLPIHITEFTCPSSGYPITNSWKKGTWTQANQAEYAMRMYKTCFAHPSIEGIIWWDLWDGASWVTNGGLLDEEFKPKLVYEQLNDLINEEWHSEGSLLTDINGEIEFRGFYGSYNLQIPSLSQELSVWAEKGVSNSFILTI